MLVNVAILRESRDYAEVVDVLEFMATELGSSANAAVQCIKESPRFQRAQTQFQRQQNDSNAQPDDPKR